VKGREREKWIRLERERGRDNNRIGEGREGGREGGLDLGKER
jgi:hypothetical protein